MHVEVLPADQVPGRAAVWVAERLWQAVAERGVAHLALSGGRTPQAMLAELSLVPAPWRRVHVWQVDERVVSSGDPDRNLTGLQWALLDHVVPLAVHTFDVDGPNLHAAAERYGDKLMTLCPDGLDVVHLGLGDDGHTASWPPGDPVVDSPSHLAGVTGRYRGHVRLTVTVPTVAMAHHRLLLVTGADKADVVGRFAVGDQSLPADRVPRDGTTLLCDEAAGALLTR